MWWECFSNLHVHTNYLKSSSKYTFGLTGAGAWDSAALTSSQMSTVLQTWAIPRAQGSGSQSVITWPSSWQHLRPCYKCKVMTPSHIYGRETLGMKSTIGVLEVIPMGAGVWSSWAQRSVRSSRAEGRAHTLDSGRLECETSPLTTWANSPNMSFSRLKPKPEILPYSKVAQGLHETKCSFPLKTSSIFSGDRAFISSWELKILVEPFYFMLLLFP